MIAALVAADHLGSAGRRPPRPPVELSGSLPEWAVKVHGGDPRFADLLPDGLSVAELAANPCDGMPANVSDALFERIARLDGLAVEELMGHYLVQLRRGTLTRQGPEPDERWHRALVARLGIGGPPPCTLEQAGALVDCTRERVRQVEAKLLAARPDRPVRLPALERAIALVAASTPIQEPEVGPLLGRAGLAAPTMTLASLLAAADFGRLNLRVCAPNGLSVSEGWVVTDLTAAVIRSARVAARQTSTYGLTTIARVTRALSDDCAVKSDHVERVLRSDPSVHFTSDGWLWVERPKNRSGNSNSLRHAARAILSVNTPQTINSIHEGFKRWQKFRQRDIVPTRVAVGEFLALHPEFAVEGKTVQAVESLDYHDVLGPVAAQVVDVLKSSPYRVMDRASLMDAVVRAGVSAATINVWTTYAEWIEHFAPNMWGLRGAQTRTGVTDAP